MGNCTVAIKKRTGNAVSGKVIVADITMSTSYATGGDTVPLASLELSSIDVLMLSGNSGGYTMEVVHGAAPTTAPKIKLYEDKVTAASPPLSEEANATNVSTIVVRAIAYGDNPHV